MRQKKVVGGLLLIALLGGGQRGWTQRSWFVPAVGRQIGIEVTPGNQPNYPMKTHEIGLGKISALRLWVYDTVASSAMGRIVDVATQRPIWAASIEVRYHDAFQTVERNKTVSSDTAGLFRLGWVGSNNPPKNRRLLIKAPGYEPINTDEVDFGGGAYLFIELSKKRR